MSDENNHEVKVIITVKGGRAAVGIQQTDCDPVFFTKEETTLPDVLAAVPGFVVEAGQKWGVSRRNPKADLPAPPALAATLAKPVQTAAATAKPKVQTPMF